MNFNIPGLPTFNLPNFAPADILKLVLAVGSLVIAVIGVMPGEPSLTDLSSESSVSSSSEETSSTGE